MIVTGICMVRDEEDIIAQTLCHMATQLDVVIVANNLSTDDTIQAIEFAMDQHDNITYVEDNEPAYLQSQKMSVLAEMARKSGADWIVPFDADEIWHAPNGQTIAEYITWLQENSDGDVYEATLHDHVVTGHNSLVSPKVDFRSFVQRTRYRRSTPLPLPKVVCRALPGLVIEMGNHGARYPGPHTQRGTDLTVCHFPYRSVDQFVRKVVNGARAYEAAGSRVPVQAGGHWKAYYDAYLRGGRDAIEEIYRTWFYSDDPHNDARNTYEICPLDVA